MLKGRLQAKIRAGSRGICRRHSARAAAGRQDHTGVDVSSGGPFDLSRPQGTGGPRQANLLAHEDKQVILDAIQNAPLFSDFSED